MLQRDIKGRQATKAFRKQLRKNGKVKCWKVVYAFDKILKSQFFSKRWNAGVNTSSRVFAKLTTEEINIGIVDNGIHVYTSYKQAKFEAFDNNLVVLPVTCRLRDFVALNRNHGEAVFTQVTVHPQTYTKLTKAT
jgi:hypothetical protein